VNAAPPGSAARVRPRATVRDPVLLGLLGLGLAVAAWHLLGSGTLTVRMATFWPIQVVLDVLFCALSWRVVRLPGLPVPTRRFWRAMVIAGVLFTVGDLVQAFVTAGSTTPHGLGGSKVQTVLVGAGALCTVGAMLTHPLAGTGQERLRLWLDAATMMTGAAAFVWTFALAGAQPAGTADLTIAVVGSALMLSAAFGLVKLLLSDNPPFTRRTGLSGSIGAGMVGVSTALVPSFDGTTNLDLVMASRLLPCILIAATPRLQELQLRADPEVLIRRRKRPYSRLPYLAVAATQVLLVATLLEHGLGVTAWGVVAGVILSTALVVVRQLAAFADNSRLLLRLRQQEERFRSLVQHASDITLVADRTAAITYASPAIQRVLGVAPEQATGRTVYTLVHPDDLPEVERTLTELAGAPRGASVTSRFRALRADGTWRWLEAISTNQLDDPSVAGIICNARDVTDAQEFENRLRYEATHDPLTHLANRALLRERLDAVAAGPADQQIAVLAVDLDDFKTVNDTLGHHVGDGLLVALGQRLLRCVRQTDTVARLGGDEFAILLTTTTPTEAETVAGRVLAALHEPVEVESHRIAPRGSVGVATGTGPSAAELLRAADAAMYDAKQRGKGTAAYAS
jgi:diguanylate cyclase (GGDEF)-like protein/PAS domain S-box-containing protein